MQLPAGLNNALVRSTDVLVSPFPAVAKKLDLIIWGLADSRQDLSILATTV